MPKPKLYNLYMHHIQKSILYRLAFEAELRFAELKPDGLENKLFDYHLKQLIRDGFVEKIEDGAYSLTANGKQAGIRSLTADKNAVKAHSVLFLIVRNGQNGPWLLYKRLVHPLKDRVGFMHASPKAGSTIEETASDELLQKTGLVATFTVLGHGFFEMYSQKSLESYTNFTVLFSEETTGELHQNHERAEYFWVENPDFEAREMLPNMPRLASSYTLGQLFFLVDSFNL